jgi:hypothetical protein
MGGCAVLRGTLDTFSAGELLWLVGRAQVTGTLRVLGPTHGVVHCRDGFVTWASVHQDDDVTDLLARAGLTTPGLGPSAAAEQIEAALREGTDAQRIHDLVRSATEDAMFQLASWDDGQIAFDTAPAHPLADSFRFPVVALLDAVRRQRARWDELAQRLGGADCIVVQAPADSGEGDFTISRSQWRLLGAVDGHRDVLGLSRAVGLGLVATAELVVALLDAGLLCIVDESTPRQAGNGALPQRSVAGPPPVTPLRQSGTRHLTAVPAGPSFEPAADGPVLTVVAAPEPEPEPAGDTGPALVALARELGLPEADYVSAGDRPSRDLILRLLSAVKEL